MSLYANGGSNISALHRGGTSALSVARYLTMACGVALVGTGLLISGKHREVVLMKCRDVSDQEAKKAQRRIDAMPLYTPRDQGRSAVQFSFNLDPGAVGESLFVIESMRLDAAVYRGPYQGLVRVEIDDSLSTDDYYDGIEFTLLRIEQKQICTWINDEGAPYWRPGAAIRIDFLQERATDDNGLPKSFNVSIDKFPARTVR